MAGDGQPGSGWFDQPARDTRMEAGNGLKILPDV